MMGISKTADEGAINEEINRLKPDLVWVGLGTPKQQDWIHRNKEEDQGRCNFGGGICL
jgi:N-acetylglucosaminyldiphosphoundecaprenol N-acetyl-beta-D-mannosaminyltransferase